MLPSISSTRLPLTSPFPSSSSPCFSSHHSPIKKILGFLWSHLTDGKTEVCKGEKMHFICTGESWSSNKVPIPSEKKENGVLCKALKGSDISLGTQGKTHPCGKEASFRQCAGGNWIALSDSLGLPAFQERISATLTPNYWILTHYSVFTEYSKLDSERFTFYLYNNHMGNYYFNLTLQ